MAVGYTGLCALAPVAGIRVANTMAGIKKPNRRDLVAFELAPGSTIAGVFTRNAFCAAPVTLARDHMGRGTARYLLINTGNANAGTGAHGMEAAEACCTAFAGQMGVDPCQVLPFSTGVIGEPLPITRIITAMPALAEAFSADGWAEAAQGIMTTDTLPKGSSRQVEIDGQPCTVTGICKGSGMIRPDMATMLAFIATDAAIDQGLLQQALNRAVNSSFNRITVDGDTSTNDSCMLMASGAGAARIDADGEGFELFVATLTEVMVELAQQIIRDGEGATKFITLDIRHARSEAEALDVAYTIAHSPLVKTAFFASDPNWGRILACVGRAGVPDLELEAVQIALDNVVIVRNGGRAADYTEEAGQQVMNQAEITVTVELARGDAGAKVWTSDLSHEYVRINAEYRT